MLSPRLLPLFVLAACAHPSERPPPPPEPTQRVEPPAPLVPAPPPPGPEADARAEAAFLALEPRFDALQAIAFDDVKRLKAALTLRVKGLTELERDYLALTKLGSREWSVAALTRIGQLHDDLAQAFRTAAAPKGLTEEQSELYRGELAVRAVPLEAKAVAAYRQAIALEGDAVAPSDWTTFARERLAQLAR